MILKMNPKEFVDLLEALIGLFALLSLTSIVGYLFVFNYMQKQISAWFGFEQKLNILQIRMVVREWLGCLIRESKEYKTFFLYQDSDMAYREAIRFFKIQANSSNETQITYREELVVKLLKFEKNLAINLPSVWAYPEIQQSIIKLWLGSVKKRILYLRSIDQASIEREKHKETESPPSPYIEPVKKSWRKVLGVTSIDAPLEDIRKKYKRLASIHHPDKGGDEEVFKEIKQAYDDAQAELNK